MRNFFRIFLPALILMLSAVHALALESIHYYSGGINSNMALGSDGSIWYANFGSIGRVATSGQAVLFPIDPRAFVDFVGLGPDGNVWAVSPNSDPPAMYVITPSGTLAHTFTLSTFAASPVSGYTAMVALGGKMWISSGFVASLTSIDTAGQSTSYPMPSPISALVSGPDGQLWAADGSQILHIDPSGSYTTFDIAQEGLPARTANAMVVGRDGKIWLSSNSAGCAYSPCVDSGAALVSISVDGRSTVYETPQSTVVGADGVAFGADGNPWLLANRFNVETSEFDTVLYRMASTGAFTSYVVDGDAQSLVSDSIGNLWFADIYSGEITKIAIPSDLLFSDRFDEL